MPFSPQRSAKQDDVTLSSSHPHGGNAINEDPQGIVDLDCRVHGTTNVLVTDASTFPSCIRVNAQWTTMAMAHYATARSDPFGSYAPLTHPWRAESTAIKARANRQVSRLRCNANGKEGAAMTFTVAALYRFAPFDDPAALRQPLLDLCAAKACGARCCWRLKGSTARSRDPPMALRRCSAISARCPIAPTSTSNIRTPRRCRSGG